jgi:hypothetical protein
MIHYSIIYAYECCEYDELTRDDLLLLCDWYARGSPENEVTHDLGCSKTPFMQIGDNMPNTKVCPECSGEMTLEFDVEHDEIPCGDGDGELAVTATWMYECNNCRYYEIIEQETKGTGELR